MKTVASIFGKTPRRGVVRAATEWPLPNQYIGIEIEVESGEGVVMPNDVGPIWTQHRDGSLRNGTEYTLASPLRGTALAEAIALIFAEGRFTRSVTGSTHIHVDMMERDTTQDVVKALVLMLYALEPALFAIGDRGREFCGYTNKLSSAPDELMASVLNSTDEQPTMLIRFCKDEYRAGRYYGINILALAKYGSVEFRYFPTATSSEELTSWVSLCQCFKKAAQEVNGVAGVTSIFENPELYEPFIANYFGPWKDVFMAEVPQYAARSAVHKALAIASSYQANGGVRLFDERAITDNEVISAKFYRKKAPKTTVNTGVTVVRDSEPAPEARLMGLGHILITVNNVYVSDGVSWQNFPYDAPTLLNRRTADGVMTSLAMNGPTITALMANRGYSYRTIDNIKNKYMRLAETLHANTGAALRPISFAIRPMPERLPEPSGYWAVTADAAASTPVPATEPSWTTTVLEVSGDDGDEDSYDGEEE